MDPPPFKTGDEVRLKTGKSKIIVLEVDYFEEGDKIPHYAKRNWGNRYVQGTGRYKPKTGWYIRFTYASSVHYADHDRKWREAEDFQFYHDQPKKEEIRMDVLYQTKEEKPRFGVHRGVNGNGEFILEMKGVDANYEAFPQDQIEEVLPYTVELTELRVDPSCKPKSIHVLAKKGQVEKADVMLELNSGIFWRVTKPDSKCRSPRENKSKWMKVPLTEVMFGEQ